MTPLNCLRPLRLYMACNSGGLQRINFETLCRILKELLKLTGLLNIVSKFKFDRTYIMRGIEVNYSVDLSIYVWEVLTVLFFNISPCFGQFFVTPYSF